MEVKNEKKVLALSFLGVITFIAVVVGATFAYFTAQSNGGANIDTNIITGTTDLLSFKFGDEINIQANQDNFGAGMGNLSDSTTGTALLRAGDTTNNVDATYNIYLIIEANDFEYTTEDQTPEILLNVTDPNGNPVENITGLVHYEDGFDITTRTGGFLLVPDYQISATNISETIQDWNIEVTFVNLDSDQNANTGKTLTGKLYMTQEQMSSYELTQINNIDSSTTYNSITVTPEITNGSGAVEKYYYGIEEATGTRSAETVEYIESDEPSHTFSNLQPNSSYTVYSYVIDENKVKSNVYQTNIATDEYENPIIDNVTHSVTLNSITVNVTASGGSNNVSKYMYKIDENDWVESESSSYTFTNLTDTTEYDIRIKVVDSENHESTEYYEAITTEVYILPVVASVDATTTWNSITLTPSGTNGTNTIDHYEYSINNGTYQTSNVFNNLSENTTYTIKVKAIDSIGRESNVYTTTVRTDTYTLPTISVSASATENSITVRVNATPGDGSIVSYHYSRDDGSNYTSSPNNSYTFDGLTSGTTYYLKVYVTDSNGRTSAVTSTSEATTYANPSVTNVTASDITSDSITINVTASGGTNNISKYYYSKDDGATWEESASNTYIFSGLTAGTTYNFKVYVTDTAGHSSTQKGVSATTNEPTLAELCSGKTFANCIKENVYTSDGVNDLYLHDGVGTYRSLEAGDNSYRYSGRNPNNYVCFGATGADCQDAENQYRIIGVFNNQVKLIKSTSYGEYAWEQDWDTQGNTWDAGTKPDIYTTLNTTYYNTIPAEWQNLIADVTWQVGGMAQNNSYTAKQYYDVEVGTGQSGYEETMKIGLMYVSDYGYGASPEKWTTALYEDNYGTDNWMYMGDIEWLISRWTGDTDRAFLVNSLYGGRVSVGFVDGAHAVRPSFSLTSTVTISSGTGTSSDPFVLNLG